MSDTTLHTPPRTTESTGNEQITEPADERWDTFVVNHEHGDVLQTSAWARVKSTSMQRTVVALERDGEIVAGAQMFTRRLAPGVALSYVPYGPIVSPTGADLERSVQRLVSELEAAAGDLGTHALLIQPPRGSSGIGEVLQTLGYGGAPTDVAGSATVEIDLTAPEADLRAQLRKSRRKNLGRAERAGVVTRTGNRSDLGAFIDLHESSARRNGFVPMTLDYAERQWNALADPGWLRMELAQFEERVEAVGWFTTFGPRVEFKLTGWLADKESSRRCPNDQLQWQMMLDSKAAGFSIFDVGGLPRAHAEAIAANGGELPEELKGTGSEFKLAYGGTVVLHPPTYERLLSPLGHVTYRLPSRLLDGDGRGSKIINRLRRT